MASVSGERCAYEPDRSASRQLSRNGGTGRVNHVYKVSSTRSFQQMLLSANKIDTLQIVVLAIQAVVWVFEYNIRPGRKKL